MQITNIKQLRFFIKADRMINRGYFDLPIKVRIKSFFVKDNILDYLYYVMCKKLVASVDRFDKVVPLTEFLGEDNLSGKPLLVRFVNRSLDVISF